MCILLCLSDTSLSHVVCCKVFSKCVMKLNFVECNQFILDGIIILCEAYECDMWSCFSLKSLEIIIAECSCDLTSTVRTEVKEYNRVFIRYNTCWLSVFLDYCRKNEFICFVIVIGCLNCCCSVSSLYTFSGCKSIVCKLYTIPAVITVHCIVTAGNGCNLTYTDFLHLSFQSLYKLFT